MPVYVDEPIHRYGRMLMCHMVADTLGELHSMAAIIGIDRKWFQNKRHPHYDICRSKRALAVRHGALEVNTRKVVQILRNLKEQQSGKNTKKIKPAEKTAKGSSRKRARSADRST